MRPGFQPPLCSIGNAVEGASKNAEADHFVDLMD